jgi:aldose sugar dehydrogenase
LVVGVEEVDAGLEQADAIKRLNMAQTMTCQREMLILIFLMRYFRFQVLGLILCQSLFSDNGFTQASEIISSEENNFRKQTIISGLADPWAMARLPDGRILVTEKAGKLRLIENEKLHPDPIEGVPEVHSAGQAGLLDVELHPDYASNGWIYFALVKKNEKGSITNIIRARLKDHRLVDIENIFVPPTEDYETGRTHFGCRIEFDQDRFLFFGIGDLGDKTNPKNRAQSLQHTAGKIHRLHDDGKVPSDNPFVQTAGARPSIWCYGVRNPQGLRFQPGTGLLWETEHGPLGGDELNIIKKGANYGWPIITYGMNYNRTEITKITEKEGMEQPVIHWTPSIAVSAIDFYTRDSFPKWKGNLLVTSLIHEKLIRVVLDAEHRVTHQEILLEGQGRIRDVQCWEDGMIHVLMSQGSILRLSPE